MTSTNPMPDRSDPQALVDWMPFSASLGITATAPSPGHVVGEMAWTEDRCTAGGLLHGGVLMAMADSLGAVCAFMHLPEGAMTATIESKTNFFRGVHGGKVIGTSTPLHVGRTTIVVQTDVRTEEGKRVVLVTQTQAVILAVAAQ